MSLNAKLHKESDHEWQVVVGRVVVADIYYFDKCEVQDPDEPPFVPFYQISISKHTDREVFIDAANTLEEAFRIADDELRGRELH